ncbi:hypothetical protein UlMin_033700 [Ulmus minor]
MVTRWCCNYHDLYWVWGFDCFLLTIILPNMADSHDLTKKTRRIEETSASSFSTSQFMSNLTEDLLSEILLGLPNCRFAVQCKTICKRWCSLISSPEFISRFIHHRHQKSLDSDSHLSKLLFQNHTSIPQDSQFCQVFPGKSKIFREIFLNFLPSYTAIRASFNDLLLVSEPSNSRDFYICNPLTRKWLALPQAPRGITDCYIRCGLVCFPNNCSNQEKCATNVRYRYKVVVVGYYNPTCVFRKFVRRPPVVTIFCSENGQWSELVDFRLPSPLNCLTQIAALAWTYNQVACNGILYWVESSDTIRWEGLVAFDPSTDVVEKQCSFVAPPIDIDLSLEYNNIVCVRLGTFQGRLRLSQRCKVGDCLGLKVWELREYDQNAQTSWSLVHNVALEIGLPLPWIFVLALHPSNTNIVFLLWNDEVFQYDISERKNKKLGKFPVSITMPSMTLSIFPLMHSSWPTPVPALPF